MAQREAIIAAWLLIGLLTAGPSQGAPQGQAASVGGGDTLAASQAKPTKETVLALAARYRKASELKISDRDRAMVQKLNTDISARRAQPAALQDSVDLWVSQLTLALAGAKSLNGVMVATCVLVETLPGSARAANLLGAVLTAANRQADAVPVYRYGVSLQPKSALLLVNLANAYLDLHQDGNARKVIEEALHFDPNNQGAWRAMAAYWYRKGNLTQFHAALMRATRFKGFVRRKAQPKSRRIVEEEAKPGESTGAMEAKLEKLADEKPLTTADIIEESYPAQARQIRELYSELHEGERLVMPDLPQTNTTTPADYRRSSPLLKEWIAVGTQKMSRFLKQDAARKGLNTSAGKAAATAKAKAEAKQQIGEQMQQAQQMLKLVQNMPEMKGKQAAIRQAMARLKQVGREQGAPVKNKPVEMDAPSGFDSGSPLVVKNYANFTRIHNSYERYLQKYFADYTAKEMDIVLRYSRKASEEEKNHEKVSIRLEEEHVRELSESSGRGGGGKHRGADVPCRQEEIRYRKAINKLGETYYKEWVNLYMPQYTQKMKRQLDAYWNISSLYIRMMNDPKVMEREYYRVRHTHLTFSQRAMASLGTGGTFRYMGPTDEEERQLLADIKSAEKDAEQKRREFEQRTVTPDKDWSDWLKDNFSVEIAGEIWGLKVTSKSIEVEAYLPPFGGSAKLDFSDWKLETQTFAAFKGSIGFKVCGVGAKLEGAVDVYRKVAEFNLTDPGTGEFSMTKGKYADHWENKTEGKATLGPAMLGAEYVCDAEMQCRLDPKLGSTFESGGG